jgi:hypothetical protein
MDYACTALRQYRVPSFTCPRIISSDTVVVFFFVNYFFRGSKICIYPTKRNDTQMVPHVSLDIRPSHFRQIYISSFELKWREPEYGLTQRDL